MTFDPDWSAAQNGLPGNQEAVNHAAQINQFLGAHKVTELYNGTSILAANPAGGGATVLETTQLTVNDHDQQFTMPAGKTVVGRVTLPIVFSGSGADLQVSLCSDSAGSPNLISPIATTIIPASWVNNLGTLEDLNLAGQLTSAQFNTTLMMNNYGYTWAQPAVGANGAATYSTPVTSGNYMIFLGGYDSVAAAASTYVASVQYLGGASLSGPMPQPSLPQAAWYGMATATTNTIVYAGGTNGTTFYSNVWTASWDPNTGIIGAWSAQASLPGPLNQASMTSWNGYVYITGGSSTGSSTNATNSVLYASTTNGQIKSWSTGTPLPQALQVHFSAAINGWLIVAGGQNNANVTQSTTYYAKINSDGSIGQWTNGPTMPTGVYCLSSGWNVVATTSALVVINANINGTTGSNEIQTLAVTTDTVGQWHAQQFVGSTNMQCTVFPHGEPGTWQLITISGGSYNGCLLNTIPMISVPLPATGLTPGATYHIYVHQIGGDLNNNYVRLSVSPNALPNDYIYRTRYTNNAWTVNVGASIIITVYDQTAGGNVIHSWQDPNTNNLATASSTMVYDQANRLLGVLDAVSFPVDPMNQNTLTTATTSPWTATNCTLTASTAQTHGGYAYSGLITPNGTSASVYITSENVRVQPSSWYVIQGWMYSPTGYADVTNVRTYLDSHGNVVSSFSSAFSLTAATWTQFSFNVETPSIAAYFNLQIGEGTTPTTSNTLYLSYVTITAFDPVTLSSVAEVNYGGSFWPPTGITQLN